MKNHSNEKEITRLGIGCSRMSNANSDRAESIATIHAALDAGIAHINTADFYSSGHNEMLIGKALKDYDRDKAFLSVKFGALVGPNGAMYGLDVRPQHIKNYLTYSLKRLGVDYVDLYQPARLDLGIPIEETIGAIADMVKAGYVKHIGVTQVDADTLRKAHSVHPILLAEYQYSLFNRSMEKDIIPTAKELGIDLVAFGTLAHGLLGGHWSKDKVNHGNAHIPLFAKENIDKNLSLVEALREIAEEKQSTVAQLAVAWMLAKQKDMTLLIGARKVNQLQESLKALDVHLSPTDITRIEEAIPAHEIAGGSFPQMKFKNGVVVHQ
ncbi:aryl-alcohol dehydrogenase-like predicted oxidoreductase [Paenibacillus shirakamiensis]|uniref:Aryl-alcohol dehydrogenase-like predicted oxidoreductase n=1 Tax=Paenibacillus shirakamiensis TaxID=1265935 RepID=A0ABS4JEH9_9BACL|nr:aldo/keto reductase [Paenibacillus shirakamiensis]MBP2000119.1 aryl-alcohol dehydrogenase-like predicted oxidoreductase [Paenibacillus shirakamiensis]